MYLLYTDRIQCLTKVYILLLAPPRNVKWTHDDDDDDCHRDILLEEEREARPAADARCWKIKKSQVTLRYTNNNNNDLNLLFP